MFIKEYESKDFNLENSASFVKSSVKKFMLKNVFIYHYNKSNIKSKHESVCISKNPFIFILSILFFPISKSPKLLFNKFTFRFPKLKFHNKVNLLKFKDLKIQNKKLKIKMMPNL